MLSRTAENLFWLARYVERAEYIARTIDATLRVTALPAAYIGKTNEWESALLTAGASRSFYDTYAEANEHNVVEYLSFNPANPSSIRNCIEQARLNSRAVRTALTVDMWSALNETWMRVREKLSPSLEGEQLAESLEWIKERSQLFSGAYNSTMLRNDAYFFTRLGTFLERADNTARILDVKYHVLLPQDEGVGGAMDYYQWQAILRSVSALRGYHWVYQDRLKPWLVAELLILRPEMPRSLLSCYQQIMEYLDLLAQAYGGKRGECHRFAGELYARLRYGRIQDIFQAGLHEFLTEFIERSTRLGDAIGKLYLT